MRRFVSFLSLCLLTGLIIPLQSCTSITVQSDYDESVDFSQYKTFGWSAHTESEKKPRRHQKKGAVDSRYKALMDKRLKTDVEEVLMNRGFSKTSPEQADLLLSFQFGLKQTTERIGFRSGGRGRGGGGISRSMKIPVTEDNIVLEMIDRETNQLVWRGWAEGELEDISKESKILTDSVQKFLADFPPQRIK